MPSRSYRRSPATPLDPHVSKRIRDGNTISRAHYEYCLAELAALRDAFDAVFKWFDVLALPGTPITATPVDEVDESAIPMSRFTRIVNCLNLCAITLPISQRLGALPVGLQLRAPASADAYLLAIANQVEDII